RFAENEAATDITWAIRRSILGQLLGGARQDQLENRGRLGSNVHHLLESGRVTLVTNFRVERITRTSAGMVVASGDQSLAPTDEIIAATGFRPDWSILSEVRLDLDP